MQRTSFVAFSPVMTMKTVNTIDRIIQITLPGCPAASMIMKMISCAKIEINF
jgi:hypothetical protein